jgi:hypothetical protein
MHVAEMNNPGSIVTCRAKILKVSPKSIHVLYIACRLV